MDVEIETPMSLTTAKSLAGKKLGVIPVLRAGLGMVDAILRLVPAGRAYRPLSGP